MGKGRLRGPSSLRVGDAGNRNARSGRGGGFGPRENHP